jgi:acyl-CoA dehydrogenase family protein 9
MIFEGTNEILRAFIALSGFQGPGKHLKEVQQAIREPIKGFGVLTDFVFHKARLAFGRPSMDRAHPRLRRETVFFEECVGELAAATDRVLRKHGSKVHLMQFAQKRIAEVAVDLYGLAAAITRTTAIIEEKGEENSIREIEYTAGFRILIEERVRSKLGRMEREEDELLKSVAHRAYADGGYPLGIL